MAARAGRHRDQAVGALVDRLVREGVVDDVVQHDAAPAVHGVVDVGARAERGDDDRHLVLGAHLHVVLEPVVALVHDLVDGERRGRSIGVRAVPRRQRLGDLGQPLVELRGRARVQRRHRADDARRALRDDELGVADDEQRRADDRQRQVLQAPVATPCSERLQGHAGHARGAVDDAVAHARAPGSGCDRRRSARCAILARMNSACSPAASALLRPPAARAPSASRPSGCPPASGTARCRRTPRWGRSCRARRRSPPRR